MSDLIMSKVFSSGVNDAAIVSTIGSNIFLEVKKNFIRIFTMGIVQILKVLQMKIMLNYHQLIECWWVKIIL